jgi:DNA transposition AAA+ family ATPase
MVLVECYDGVTEYAFMRSVCHALGDREVGGSTDRVIRIAGETLSERTRGLAIDEANFLKTRSINQLVYVWNRARSGITLLGTEELDRIIKSSDLQRVRSRMKLIVHLGILSDGEIRRILEKTFPAKSVTAKVLELARVHSFASYRDLETIMAITANYWDANPEKGLEAVFEYCANRFEGPRMNIPDPANKKKAK